MTVFRMLVGLPASGKSTYVKNLEQGNWLVVSSDEYRKVMFDDVDTQDHNTEVFQKMFDDTVSSLISRCDVIYDATNINYKRRKHLVSEIKHLVPNVECECVMFATPYEDCLKYNANRERKVPESVIKKMYLNFYVPAYYEGWDSIEIKWNYNESEYTFFDLVKRMNISQDNSHHKLSLIEHLQSALDFVEIFSKDRALNVATFLHDIGKPFTKSFTNFKGESTTEAHYFNHQNVGAYDSLFYTQKDYNECVSLNIANLIQWHMQPYFMETQKSKDKFKALVSEDMYNDVMLLHEADEVAH